MQQFFILGNPRSGTSLLRLILNSHSKVVVPPESGFFLWWSKKYAEWNVDKSKNPELIDQYISDVKSSKKMETWNLDFNLVKANIYKQNPKDYLTLSQIIYQTYAFHRAKEPTVIGDKNNYYINHLETLYQLVPSAKFLHIIRDGRDVACSYQELAKLDTNSPYKPDLPTNIEAIANEWLINNSNILEFSKKIMRENFLSIRYEDLVLAIREQAELMCSFLGISYDANMLQYYKDNKQNVEEPISTLDWKKKTLEKPDTNNINKYKKILSIQEIENFNSVGGDMLRRFRYEF